METKLKPEGCKHPDKLCLYIKGGVIGEKCDNCRTPYCYHPIDECLILQGKVFCRRCKEYVE